MLNLISSTQPKTLRPHQAKAIEMVRHSFGQGNRRVVCQGPTGFGKTLVAAKVIEATLAKGNRVIFTAPAISLIDQSVAAFEAEGIRDIGVMQGNHPRTNSLARVQVASVQTLGRREIPEAALVIVDEAHIRAKVIEDLMDTRPDVFFLGLSATPWAKGMGLRWQDLAIPCDIDELITGGFLSKFTVFAPDVPDLSSVPTRGGDFAEDDVADVMGGAALMGSVVETWLAKGEDRPTLLFGVNRVHARSLADEFERAGIATAYVDCFTDSVERQMIEQRFRAGEVKIACSVRTLTTGVDWPVGCIIDAAPTKSEMLHVQKIGRGLRINPGTEDLLVLDHAGNSLRLGLVTDIKHTALDKTKPSERQPKAKQERLPKPCSKCGAVHSGLTCGVCGHQRKPFADVEAIDGELVEITSTAPKPNRADKQIWWSGLTWIAQHRGYKRGWASNQYRERFGVWPRGLADFPIEPTREISNWVKSRQIAYAKRRQSEAA